MPTLPIKLASGVSAAIFSMAEGYLLPRLRILPSLWILLLLVPGSGVRSQTRVAKQLFVSGASAPGPVLPWAPRPFSKIAVDGHASLAGLGMDVATPLSRHFNLRAGSDLFSCSTTFQDQGASIAVHLRMQSAHALLDWFPLGGRFRLSPMLVFANNNRAQATALIPAGNTITLDGEDYISSLTDPLHGSGSVDFHKASPGLTLGFGNVIAPRHHFSFPVEAGFYYVGQPGLKVAFSGSACDPTQPPAIGCESVDQDAGFQQNLAAFIVRNHHNLSYARFFPVYSAGLGYAF